MPRYITLGIYTNQGAAGLVDGDSDRRAAMEVMHKIVGARLVDYYIYEMDDIIARHLLIGRR